jgi:hypothetical protein
MMNAPAPSKPSVTEWLVLSAFVVCQVVAAIGF